MKSFMILLCLILVCICETPQYNATNSANAIILNALHSTFGNFSDTNSTTLTEEQKADKKELDRIIAKLQEGAFVPTKNLTEVNTVNITNPTEFKELRKQQKERQKEYIEKVTAEANINKKLFDEKHDRKINKSIKMFESDDYRSEVKQESKELKQKILDNQQKQGSKIIDKILELKEERREKQKKADAEINYVKPSKIDTENKTTAAASSHIDPSLAILLQNPAEDIFKASEKFKLRTFNELLMIFIVFILTVVGLFVIFFISKPKKTAEPDLPA